MRVIAGELRGRTLRVPRGRNVRPTADRVRGAIFDRLGALEGARVLDLYAGSGALGIEALSRGAVHVVFVERAPAVLAVLRGNLRTLELAPRARVVAAPVERALRRLQREDARFDLALLDPPYADPGAGAVLAALAASGLLAPGARGVVESDRRRPPEVGRGLSVRGRHRYGDTLVTLFDADAGPPEAAGVQRRDGEP